MDAKNMDRIYYLFRSYVIYIRHNSSILYGTGTELVTYLQESRKINQMINISEICKWGFDVYSSERHL